MSWSVFNFPSLIAANPLTTHSTQVASYGQLQYQHAKLLDRKGKGLPEDPNDSPFFFIGWLRVIADESDKFRNPKASIAQACLALKKQYGLCLTATPLHVRYPAASLPSHGVVLSLL